jgi:hypothetical protein
MVCSYGVSAAQAGVPMVGNGMSGIFNTNNTAFISALYAEIDAVFSL